MKINTVESGSKSSLRFVACEKTRWGVCASAYQPRTRHSVLGDTLFITVMQHEDATGWGVHQVSRGDKRLLVAPICPGDQATCRHNVLTSIFFRCCRWLRRPRMHRRRLCVSLTRRNAAALNKLRSSTQHPGTRGEHTLPVFADKERARH